MYKRQVSSTSQFVYTTDIYLGNIASDGVLSDAKQIITISCDTLLLSNFQILIVERHRYMLDNHFTKYSK